MTRARKGRPSEVWTPEQRRRLSATMKAKHRKKMDGYAMPKSPEPLTPEEVAEIEAEQREKANAARDFVNEFRRLACEHNPIDPAVEALFRRCGIDDVAHMRELAEWAYILSLTPDDIELRIELEVARRCDPRFAQEKRR